MEPTRKKLNEDRPYYQQQISRKTDNNSSFWICKVYGDIGGFLGEGRPTTMGFSAFSMAIFSGTLKNRSSVFYCMWLNLKCSNNFVQFLFSMFV